MFKIDRLIVVVFTVILTASTVLAQDAKVSGSVSFNGSVFLHDASVQIVQLRRTVLTNAEGAYEFTGVPAGRYTLLVHIDGFSDAAKIIDVPAGGQLTVDFEMQVSGVNEQVTITASGSEQTVFDSFQSVTSVGSTGITQRSATSLGEVLESEVGISKRSFGVGSSRPVIRGFDGDRVLILQNGQRTGSIGSQSGDHGETTDSLSAERIEVVKGPATLLYGSNAIGGVVNVISNDENKAHDGLRGFITGFGGTTNNSLGFSSGLDYGVKNWIFRGSASAQRSGDYRTPIGKIPNSAARSNSESFGAGYFRNKAYAMGSFDIDVRRYGIPYAALFEGGGMTKFGELPPAPDDDIDLRQRSYGFKFNGGFRDWKNPFLSGMQYNIGYSDYRHKEIEVIDGTDETGTIFTNKSFSYRSLFEQSKYKALTGRFGFEGFNRDYEVNGAEQLVTGKVKQNSVSVFGLEEVSFDRIKFQFGGRLENNRYTADDPRYLDRSFTGLSAAVGMNVALWKGGAFVANYSNSFRAPALEELYNNGPHIGTVTFEIGNENLKGERTNGIDVSLRHYSDRFRFTGDVYYYRVNNFVFLAFQDEDGDGNVDIEDGLPVARYEQENASYLGIEVGAEARFNKYFGAFVNADAVRARLPEIDLNLPRIPQGRLRLGADFSVKGLNVRPELSFIRKQNKTYPLETPTAGYSMFDVSGSYTVASDHYAHIFTFNAFNLTDRLYRNHLSFIKDLAPEMGRGIRFGYTFRFF
ncbi:MAG: TonB-dependent receptor [Acidobacteria bacterium]|nr:TonB-dependent receptor [Acidobacteriota bacterium]